MPGARDLLHPIGSKTLAPQYQPIDRKKGRRQKWSLQLKPTKKYWPCS